MRSVRLICFATVLFAAACGSTTTATGSCSSTTCVGCCNGNTCLAFANQTNDLCGVAAECTPCNTELVCQQGLCAPADVCATNNGGCDPNAKCAPAPAPTTCTCLTGYTGDGTHCSAIVSALSASPGVLSPAFRPELLSYIVVVPAGTTSVQLSASTTTPNGSIAYNGTGNATVTLSTDSVSVTVQAIAGAARSAAYTVLIQRSANTLAEHAYVKASNTTADARFGHAVALSADGSVMAIGAPGETNRSGATYVFRRASDGTWAQEALLKASNAESNDAFGWSVSVSGDGSTVAVGAPGEDGEANAKTDSGAVYVFRHASAGWSQEALLRGSNADPGDGFGWSVSSAADGATLICGAPFEDGASNSTESTGAAYLWSRTGTTWAEQTILRAQTPKRNLLFGRVVGLSGDALTAVVGSPNEDSGGVVSIFRGAPLAFDADVHGANTQRDDEFGGALSLSNDGRVLAVGAANEGSLGIGVNPNPSAQSASASGAAYVFRRADSGWGQEAFIKATNTHEGDAFGSAVALSGDGATLACGAPGEDSEARGVEGDETTLTSVDSGAVFLYRFAGSAWARNAYVKASNSARGDAFGSAVAVSSTGSRLVASSPGDDSPSTGLNGDSMSDTAMESGACFVFDPG